MGRELRMVPKGWEHPKDDEGRYVPLFNSKPREVFLREVAEWYENQRLWSLKQHPDQLKYDDTPRSFEDWDGGPPNPDDRMPCWETSERTHFQMYESTTEGTPISPVCESAEELARWLVDNRASSFAHDTATYEQWLGAIKVGWAPSMVFTEQTGLVSGVEFVSKK